MTVKATLFYNPQVVEATLFVGERRNLPMYHSEIKIFRGVDNVIEFSLKNSDRQPVKLFNYSFKVIVTNPYNGQLMLTKYLYNVDEQKGKYSLKLTPGDIQEWSAGFYQFCVLKIDECGDEELFFTTLDQDVTGRFELIDKPFPAFTPSHLIVPEDFTQIQFDSNIVTNQNFWVTSRFPGDAQKNFSDGLHTFSILTDNFSGMFWIEGSLEENPVLSSDWFNIPVDGISDVIQFTNSSQLDVFNFEANLVWVRFKYQPMPYQTGKIAKIWFKN